MVFRRKSYAETVEGRRRFVKRLFVLLLVYLAYEAVSGIFVSAYAAASRSMHPLVETGDMLLSTPLIYGPESPFGKLPPMAKPERGELVLVAPPYARSRGFFKNLADSLLRFFTFQRLSLVRREPDAVFERPVILRVIGLPGDTVVMNDFIFKVRPAGSGYFLTEFELSNRSYNIVTKDLPAAWSDDFPLSGSMRERTLASNEYFVAGDNRGLSSDSRVWGPVSPGKILGKVLMRYWPLRRFGLL